MRGKLILAGAILFILALTNGITAYKFYGFGQDNIQTKWDASKLVTVDKKLTVKAKQDEIQNAPVDVRVTNRRMRNDTF